MNTNTCCFKIKYSRQTSNSKSLYSNEFEGLDDFERLQSFIRTKQVYTFSTFDNYISENETIESLDHRFNELIDYISRRLGKIIKVEKREPIYDEAGLYSWSVLILLEFIEPIEQIDQFEDSYRIGLVCRAKDDESSFTFFDRTGVLYQLDKGEKDIIIGDIIVFKIHKAFIYEKDEFEIDNDYDITDDDPDDYDYEEFVRCMAYYFPYLLEEERIRKERKKSYMKPEPKGPLKYTLLPDFVLFSELKPHERGKRGFSSSMKSLTYSIKGNNVSLYNDFERCVLDSYKESILLRCALLPAETDTILSSYTTLQTKCSEIWNYINDLNIENIFSSYKVLIWDTGIVNHHDERYREFIPSIVSDDKYILSLFPLKKTGYEWFYTNGDEEIKGHNDIQKEKKAIEAAYKKYNKYEHFSYLLYNDIEPIQQRLVLQREVNRFWPLNYFEDLLSLIPEQNLAEFINSHNKRRLFYRDVIFDYIKTEKD